MVVLERQCLALMEEVEHSNEKQEHLATLMESKMNVQKVAPADFQRQIFQESKTAGRSRRQGCAGTRTKEDQVDKMGR